MAVNYSLIAGAVAAIYMSLQWLLYYTQDAREPSPLATAIPFISPIIGMTRQKSSYYVKLRYGKPPRTIY
jgi:hypothetical protein